MEMPVQEYIEGECEVCPDVVQEEVIIDEAAIVVPENCDECQIVEEAEPSGLFPHCGQDMRRPSFLQRFNNWLSR